MQNITYSQRSKAAFYCDIVGNPIPNFTWFRGDKQVTKEDKEYRIKIELWGSMYVIFFLFSCLVSLFFDQGAELRKTSSNRVYNPSWNRHDLCLMRGGGEWNTADRMKTIFIVYLKEGFS